MQVPYTDPSNEGSLEGVFKTVLDKFMQNLDNRLPCIVLDVDRNKNRVKVKPLIRRLKTDGTTLERSQVVNVPIQNMSAGGFIINFPINVGDLGWLQSCDRDITLYKQTYKETKPNTKRKHTFEDSIFIPDVTNHNSWNIDNEDTNSLVIQSYDNSTKISMANGKITIQSETIEFRATNNIFTGGTIQHDGISIDKTHIHAQGADSDGDSEQDTTPPIN